MAVKQALIILCTINVQSDAYVFNLDLIRLNADDQSSNEPFHLTFPEAQFYAKCYPKCHKEPSVNPLHRTIKDDTCNDENTLNEKSIKESSKTPSDHDLSSTIDSNSKSQASASDDESKSSHKATSKLVHKALKSPITNTNAFFDNKDVPKSTFNPNPSIVAYRADYLTFDNDDVFDYDSYTMDVISDVKPKLHPKPKFKMPHSNSLNSVLPITVCDDIETFCPGGSCCQMRNGNYGCCPYLEGTCCRNNVQCCPKGYECVNWPNSIRESLRKLFGMEKTAQETRCRIDYSAWIWNQIDEWSGKNKEIM